MVSGELAVEYWWRHDPAGRCGGTVATTWVWGRLRVGGTGDWCGRKSGRPRWQLNITKRPTTRPATRSAELDWSQQGQFFIRNFVSRESHWNAVVRHRNIHEQKGGEMCRGDQSHLPNYKLLTTPNTNYTPGPPLLSEEPDQQVSDRPSTNIWDIGITLLRMRGETLAVGEMRSVIGGRDWREWPILWSCHRTNHTQPGQHLHLAWQTPGKISRKEILWLENADGMSVKPQETKAWNMTTKHQISTIESRTQSISAKDHLLRLKARRLQWYLIYGGRGFVPHINGTLMKILVEPNVEQKTVGTNKGTLTSPNFISWLCWHKMANFDQIKAIRFIGLESGDQSVTSLLWSVSPVV